MFIKICPICKKNIEIKSKYSVNNDKPCKSCKAKEVSSRPEILKQRQKFIKKYATAGVGCGKENPFYGKKHNEESLKIMRESSKEYTKTSKFKNKMSIVSSGKNNPMYNKTVYSIWVEKYGKIEADVKYEKYCKKLSLAFSGEKNPMYGKPSPQGSGNGWSGWYKKWYFRSLKELSYVVNLDKMGVKWKTASKVRIKYIDTFGTIRTYTPDFIVGNILVEVKPEKLKSSILVRLKEEAAKIYCKNNGMEYEIIDPITLSDEKIMEMQKSGLIKFLPRYQKKFEERCLALKLQCL